MDGSCSDTLFADCITIPLDVTRDDVITGVAVGLTINHESIGDLVVSLVHAGTEVTLLSNLANGAGSAGQCAGIDITNLWLTDTAAASVQAQCAGQLAGVYAPAQSLTAFHGMTSSGRWTLAVRDTFVAFSDGAVVSWDLRFQFANASVYRDADRVDFAPATTRVERVVTVVDTHAVTQASVWLHLQASSINQIAVQLAHPDGTVIPLLRPNTTAGCSTGTPLRALRGMTFDTTSSDSLEGVLPCPTPTLWSGQALADGNLSVLEGRVATGDWTLRVENNGGNVVLFGWELWLTTRPNVAWEFESSVLSFVGNDSESTYRTLLASVVYANTQPIPDPSDRFINVSAIDGAGDRGACVCIVLVSIVCGLGNTLKGTLYTEDQHQHVPL